MQKHIAARAHLNEVGLAGDHRRADPGDHHCGELSTVMVESRSERVKMNKHGTHYLSPNI